MIRTLSKPESVVDAAPENATPAIFVEDEHPSQQQNEEAKTVTTVTVDQDYDSPIKHIQPNNITLTELEEEPYSDSHVMSQSEGVGSESINHEQFIS